MKRVISVITILVIASIAVLWWYSNRINLTKELATIKIGYRPTVAVDLAMLKALEDKKFFKQGINIELKPYSNAILLFAGLKSGEINGSLGVPLELILGMKDKKGQYPVQGYLVWYFDAKTPYDGFLVKDNSLFKKIEDLNGKVIATHPSRQVTAFVKKMVPGAKIKTYNPATPLLPLQNDDVDAVFVLEPFLSIAESSGKFRILEAGSISKRVFSGRPVPAALSVLSSDWVKKNPELARKYVSIAQEAYNQLKEGDKEKLLQKVKYGGFSLKVSKRIYEPKSSLPEELNVEGLKLYSKILQEDGLLKKPINIKTLLYITNKK